MRTLINKDGIIFDPEKNYVFFAEDWNEVVGKIEDIEESLLLKVTDDAVLHNTGDENVDGIKTFVGTELNIKRAKNLQRRLVFSNTTDSHVLIVYQPADTNEFRIYSTVAGGDKFTIKENGNIGINTNNPMRNLEVNNAMRFTNDSLDDNDGVVGTAVYSAGLNIVGIDTDSTYRKIATWGNFVYKQNFPPNSSTSQGEVGEVCYDANYIYRCVAPNTWKRTLLSTW